MPVEVIFFNVGQGDCTLLYFYELDSKTKAQVGTAAVLVDAGSTRAAAHVTDANIVMQRQNVSQKVRQLMVDRIRDKIASYLAKLKTPDVLSYLLITHPDQDHFNLLQDLLLDAKTKKLRYRIEYLWYTCSPSEYKEGRRDFVVRLLTQWKDFADGDKCVANKPRRKWYLGEPQQMLWLSKGPPRFPNLFLIGAEVVGVISERDADKLRSLENKVAWANASCIVLLLVGDMDPKTKGSHKLFLMADALELQETFLRGADLSGKWYGREQKTWLKLGHHGSSTSTGKDWIKYIEPDALLISSGSRIFLSSGIPTFTHLEEEVIPVWRTLGLPAPVIQPTSKHNYVYYNNKSPKGFTSAETEDAICTTLMRPPSKGGKRPRSPMLGDLEWLGCDWHLTFDDPQPGACKLEYK